MEGVLSTVTICRGHMSAAVAVVTPLAMTDTLVVGNVAEEGEAGGGLSYCLIQNRTQPI